MKLEIPGTKIQRNSQPEATKPLARLDLPGLEFGVSLELGAWNLEFGARFR
jgi:hypothetical protein